MTDAYIALGANLGDRLANLQGACAEIDKIRHTRILKASRIYESRAVGPGAQPRYLNAVISIATNCSALQFLDALQAIENAAGRERSQHWGPRTLDLDILLFGELHIESERLRVPHPQLFKRDFVLRPLMDLVPEDWRFPDHSTPAEHLETCADNALVYFEGSLIGTPINTPIEEGIRA